MNSDSLSEIPQDVTPDEAADLTPSLRDQFFARLREVAGNGSFIRLTLGKPSSKANANRVVVTPVVLKSGLKLSFRFTRTRGEETKNYETEDALRILSGLIPSSFLASTLFTGSEDVSLVYSKRGVPSLRKARPSLKAASPAPHNREKSYLIPASEAFLHNIGITSLEGRVRPDMNDKFRQINKFVEVIDSLVRHSALEGAESISAVDYGSGKSYLTFALYHYLTVVRERSARVKGIEARPELVKFANNAATTSGFEHLVFEQGEITTSSVATAELVVALHACDTATDDAIVKAIETAAAVIAVAPCCQKYVRPRMKVSADLVPVFKHGILEERLAESLTNGLRALILEAYGYDTKVFEFIGGEHTAKNVMITAVRRAAPDAARKSEKLREIRELKAKFSLEDFYLDRALGV